MYKGILLVDDEYMITKEVKKIEFAGLEYRVILATAGCRPGNSYVRSISRSSDARVNMPGEPDFR